LSKKKNRLFRIKMTLNKKHPFFSLFFASAVMAFVLFGCAVPQKPSGGPKDVTPPKLLKATPANQTRNFSSKTIQLDFDEYFKLNGGGYTEINISPSQKHPPEFKIKDKSLIITLKDTLQKNTTYVINFGKAIGDLHENNILKNFTYVFSTGPHIDSLSISGNVINVLTQDREKDVTIMLFTLKQDSALFGKKAPSVYTTTDTAGNFTLGNLHDGVYRLYALKENGGSEKVYHEEKDLIGVPHKTINLQTDTTGVKLTLFKQIPQKFRFLSPGFGDDGRVQLFFNRPVEKPSLRIIYPPAQNLDKYVDISKTRDTALLYVKNMDFDTLKVALSENGKPIDTVTVHKGRKESYTRILSAATNADTRAVLKPGSDLLINTSSPLSSFDPSLIVLNEDSTVVTNYTIKQDTANRKHLVLNYKWRQNANYILTLNEGALTGYFGEKNKKIIRKFKIEKPENYGQLTLKVTVPDTSRSYIVELMTEQNVVLYTTPIRQNTPIIFRAILAGKYRMRVIYDDNNNGKWDTGSIRQNRQPENIWVNRSIINVRASFENDLDIDIPREPTP